jgi:hypothetical protein
VFSNYISASVPADYVPRYLAFKLPEHIIILVAIGFALGIRALFTGKALKNLPAALPYFLLVYSMSFPVIYAAVSRSYLYDEIRHFLFIVPPLFCLVGITYSRVMEWALQGRTAGRLALAATGVLLLSSVRLMAQLHPYEYTYYNRLIGGVHGAHQRIYETEYWATSYREGVQRLEGYLRARDADQFEKKQYRILVSSPEFAATYYFPQNFLSVREPSEAQIFLSTTRSGADEAHGGLEVVRIERFGVPFTIGKILVDARKPE